MAAAPSSSSSSGLASLLHQEEETGRGFHLNKWQQAIPPLLPDSFSIPPSPAMPPDSMATHSFSLNSLSFIAHLPSRSLMPLFHSVLHHCRKGSVHLLQSRYSPLLLSSSIVEMLSKVEADSRATKEENDNSVDCLSQSAEDKSIAPEAACQQKPSLANRISSEMASETDSELEEEEEEEEEEETISDIDDYGNGKSEEEEEEDDIRDDDSEDEFIQFSDTDVSAQSSSAVVQSTPVAPVSLLIQPPLMKHISSFSSEESGYCENPSYPEWSDSEEDEEEDEDTFDEGLWHMFQDQACFTGVPKDSTLTPTHGLLQSVKDCVAPLAGSGNVSDRSRLCHDLSTNEDNRSSRSAVCSTHVNTSSGDRNTGRQPKSIGKERRRVCFKPDDQLTEVHCMVAWKFAYRSARKGDWERYSADMARFKERIKRVAAVVEPCLEQKLLKGDITHTDNE